MKVSNGVSIQRIYQEQVKKVRSGQSGEDFKKVLESAEKTSEVRKPTFHPPSGINVANPVFSGKPVKEADPIETLKYAAEVVAAQPDIREERVNQIKKLIESGQYNVPAEAVAERLLKSGILTRSWDE